jgi:hypothetical protein
VNIAENVGFVNGFKLMSEVQMSLNMLFRNMKEGVTKTKNVMDMAKQHYQIKTHTKECTTVVNGMAKVSTGEDCIYIVYPCVKVISENSQVNEL